MVCEWIAGSLWLFGTSVFGVGEVQPVWLNLEGLHNVEIREVVGLAGKRNVTTLEVDGVLYDMLFEEPISSGDELLSICEKDAAT
jgi:hypothetical protein